MDQMLSPGFSIPSIGTPLHQMDPDQQIVANPVYHPPAQHDQQNGASRRRWYVRTGYESSYGQHIGTTDAASDNAGRAQTNAIVSAFISTESNGEWRRSTQHAAAADTGEYRRKLAN